MIAVQPPKKPNAWTCAPIQCVRCVDVIQGVADVGEDLTKAARGIVVGVIRATKETGTEALGAISATAGAVVKSTSEGGGDVAGAARGAVEGAIEGAREVGLSAEDAASAAASGAVKAAGGLGSTVVEQVRDAVTGTISGVKVILREPFKGEDVEKK